MADYGHDLLFGSFITPSAQQPETVVGLAQLSEGLGLDLVTFQDHPYQPAFLDTWTLMSFVAARTERIHISANVLNLPLRPPVVMARGAASLDLLSGGRFELGLGAGGFWDAIEAAGGPRRTPGESVEALEEAIGIIRAVWAENERGGIHAEGKHYRVSGAKRGPAPAHDIGIWLGAYKPRMLRLIGRAADGWLPSLPYLPGGAADLPGLNGIIDDSAVAAGRQPSAIRRLLNIGGQFSSASRGFLQGPADQWAEELAGLTLEHGISAFILVGDDPTALERFATEVAPAVRDLVAAERLAPSTRLPVETVVVPAAATATTTTFSVVPTRDDGIRLATVDYWDESARPAAPPAPADYPYTAAEQEDGQRLIDVHDHLRQELADVRDLIRQVQGGVLTVGDARTAINEMTLKQNNWTLGAYCSSYCRLVTQHHTIEDVQLFPHLRAADAGLVPVVDRLEQEHVIIHEVLEGVDRALVAFVGHPEDFSELQHAMDVLSDALLSHLSYEETQLVEPLARFGAH